MLAGFVIKTEKSSNVFRPFQFRKFISVVQGFKGSARDYLLVRCDLFLSVHKGSPS